MLSLLSLALNKNWDKCHAMLDRGEGDVHEKDKVGSALDTFSTRHDATPTLPHSCLR
jgi:hypothetical protein